jgi:hypothetical protein
MDNDRCRSCGDDSHFGECGGHGISDEEYEYKKAAKANGCRCSATDTRAHQPACHMSLESQLAAAHRATEVAEANAARLRDALIGSNDFIFANSPHAGNGPFDESTIRNNCHCPYCCRSRANLAALSQTPASVSEYLTALEAVAKLMDDLFDAGKQQRANFDRRYAYDQERDVRDALANLAAVRERAGR